MKNKLQILTIALVSLIFTNGYSSKRTWDGSSDGNWTNDANWSSSKKPVTGDEVVIPTGLSNYPSTNISGSYLNLTINSNTLALTGDLTVTGTLTVNGSSSILNLNGHTLTTTAPTLTNSGSITSTNANSYLDISTSTFTNSLISLTAGWVEYDNLTIASSQTVTNSTLITGTLRLNSGANLNLNGKYVDLLSENIDVRGNATITGTSLQKLNAWNGTLDIDGGTLTLNNVEVVIQHLKFSTSHDIVASNGGFLSFDNQTDHDINNNSPGFATNDAHVNAKVRLYTRNGRTNTFNFPIGDGSVYSPYIFAPTSVTGTDSFGQWVEVTYTGAEASQKTLDGSTLKGGASGYEYWTVESSASTLTGKVALRFDNSDTKTGKTVLSSGSDATKLILAQYNVGSSKWFGIAAGTNANSNITTTTTSSSVNPTSDWTIGSNTTGTGFFVALPVTLINFDAVANKTNKTVDVRWATASEENNSHFEIMHSTDFVHWTSIVTVYSKGNGNDMNLYSYTDINPGTVNQYKLKIVALNGEVSYSSIKLVKFTETVSANVSVYPNPANANVNLSVNNMDMSTPITIQLLNTMGQVVFEQIISENASGMVNANIPTSELSAGIYQVSITSAAGTVSQKLSINH